MHMLQIWQLHLEVTQSHSILPSKAKTCYAYFKHIYVDLIVFVYQDRGHQQHDTFIFRWSWSFDLWNIAGVVLTGINSKMTMDEFFRFEMINTTFLSSYFIKYVCVYWMVLIMYVCFFFTCRDDVEHEISWPSGRAVVHVLLGDSWCRVDVVKVLTSNVNSRHW